MIRPITQKLDICIPTNNNRTVSAIHIKTSVGIEHLVLNGINSVLFLYMYIVNMLLKGILVANYSHLSLISSQGSNQFKWISLLSFNFLTVSP